MYSIRILNYGINDVLSKHLEKMNLDRITVEEKIIFIYNISILNILIGLLQKLNGQYLVYHIHDPVPHTGWKKVPTYCLQWVLILISNKIVVFSTPLAKKTASIYKTKVDIITAPHGYSETVSEIKEVKKEYNYGWFGTYAPYKYNSEIEEIIRFMGNEYSYLFVGKGYPKSLRGSIYSGYIPEKKYYFLMASTKCLVVDYKDISFSGVIHDGVGLNKDFLANELCKEYILNNYDDYYLVEEFKGLFLLSKNGKSKTHIYGWCEYVNKVFL